MKLRASLLVALCAPLASACFQQLDDQASSQWNPTAAVEVADGGSGAPFPVNLTTPPIGATANESGDVSSTAATACDKVRQDAHDVRQRVCSACHEGPSAQGAPLKFILEDDMLINAKSTSTSNEGKTYIIPGDPDNSLIYRRAAIVEDMPPGTSDVRNPTTSLTVSDFSVLRAWILNCTGDTATQASPAASADGGAGTVGS